MVNSTETDAAEARLDRRIAEETARLRRDLEGIEHGLERVERVLRKSRGN